MMNEELYVKPGERVDHLLTRGFRIIQSDDVFSFSIDAVLLARFCTVPISGRIMDLCTGNGVIPMLLATRTKAKIDAVEIQKRLADMAMRNMRMNGLEEQIHIFHADLKEAHKRFGNGKYDLVTVNPPYLPAGTGDPSINPHIAAARHELFCTLDDVLFAASRLVRSGGKVAIVHRPSRLADLICGMRKHRLEPKRIRFIHPRAGEEANMVLAEAIRDGRPEIRLLPPLYVFEGSQYCQELIDIYEGKSLELAGGQDSGQTQEES
jgi:tRNA1(Val) A37 N6-methylase TrmN6